VTSFGALFGVPKPVIAMLHLGALPGRPQHDRAAGLESIVESVRRDLQRFLARIVPEDADYEHDSEGADDMPSHIRAALTRTAETLPVSGGDLALGTWQAIYLWEHRRAPHQRSLVVTVWGQ